MEAFMPQCEWVNVLSYLDHVLADIQIIYMQAVHKNPKRFHIWKGHNTIAYENLHLLPAHG